MQWYHAVMLVSVAAWSATEGLAKPQESAPAPAKTAAAEDGLAMTPPMGWYPWNQFGQEPQNEKLIKEIADAMVASGMRETGYSYVGPDEGICFYRNDKGRLATNLKRYPSGLRGLGDYIHKKGLRYALYTDAGNRTCSKAMPGTKGYEYEDMKAFADWRCDYLKIDWCNTKGQDIVKTYTTLREAQRGAGRPVVHALCTWGKGEPWTWAAAISHLWRTTGDICAPGRANWKRALQIAFANQRLHPYAGPGHWNDPDMMITGMDGLSEAQNRSFFSLWCIMAAPLIAGNDLRTMSRSTVEILTNLEAIAVNQDPLGKQGHVVRKDGKVSIWAGKPLYDGGQAVLALNQGAEAADVQIKWTDLGLDEKAELYARNLWTHATTGPHAGGISVKVAPNDVAMFRVCGKPSFPVPPIISADSYLVTFRIGEGAMTQSHSKAIRIIDKGTNALPAWKTTSRLPAWLNVAVTKEGKEQTVRCTVSPAGLSKGLHHTQVRLDNTEPVSGRPLSAFYFDVDLEVTQEAKGK